MIEDLVMLMGEADSSVAFCGAGIWAGIPVHRRWSGRVGRYALAEESWGEAFSSPKVQAVLACCHCSEGRLVARRHEGGGMYFDAERAYPKMPNAVSAVLLFGCATWEAREALRLDTLTAGAIYYKYWVGFYCLTSELGRSARVLLGHVGRIWHDERTSVESMGEGLRAMYREALSENDRRYLTLLRNADDRASVYRVYGIWIGLQLEGLEVV